jgi:hypothetical protein
VVAATAGMLPMQRDYLEQMGAGSDLRLKRAISA